MKGKIVHSIREEVMNVMKYFQYTLDIEGLNYEDLCRHPHLELPKGFKAPNFDTFSGFEYPLTHLRSIVINLLELGQMRLC